MQNQDPQRHCEPLLNHHRNGSRSSRRCHADVEQNVLLERYSIRSHHRICRCSSDRSRSRRQSPSRTKSQCKHRRERRLGVERSGRHTDTTAQSAGGFGRGSKHRPELYYAVGFGVATLHVCTVYSTEDTWSSLEPLRLRRTLTWFPVRTRGTNSRSPRSSCLIFCLSV